MTLAYSGYFKKPPMVFSPKTFLTEVEVYQLRSRVSHANKCLQLSNLMFLIAISGVIRVLVFWEENP